MVEMIGLVVVRRGAIGTVKEHVLVRGGLICVGVSARIGVQRTPVHIGTAYAASAQILGPLF